MIMAAPNTFNKKGLKAYIRHAVTSLKKTPSQNGRRYRNGNRLMSLLGTQAIFMQNLIEIGSVVFALLTDKQRNKQAPLHVHISWISNNNIDFDLTIQTKMCMG